MKKSGVNLRSQNKKRTSEYDQVTGTAQGRSAKLSKGGDPKASQMQTLFGGKKPA